MKRAFPVAGWKDRGAAALALLAVTALILVCAARFSAAEQPLDEGWNWMRNENGTISISPPGEEDWRELNLPAGMTLPEQNQFDLYYTPEKAVIVVNNSDAMAEFDLDVPVKPTEIYHSEDGGETWAAGDLTHRYWGYPDENGEIVTISGSRGYLNWPLDWYPSVVENIPAYESESEIWAKKESLARPIDLGEYEFDEIMPHGDLFRFAEVRMVTTEFGWLVTHAYDRTAQYQERASVHLYLTYDGGTSWRETQTPAYLLPTPTDQLRGAEPIIFSDDGKSAIGIPYAGEGLLARTTDAGETWEPIGLPDKTFYRYQEWPKRMGIYLIYTGNQTWELHCAEESEKDAETLGYIVYISQDAGLTWKETAHSRIDRTTYRRMRGFEGT